MPSFDIVKEHNAGESFRVESIIQKFELQSNLIKEKFVGEIDLDFDWNIGLIVGASGTGKTTILKELFSEHLKKPKAYSANSIVDDMPKNCSMEQITRTFNSVGFSSPPSLLKPYKVLSNGEKMRVDLARSLLAKKPITVFDEFTSVVDRNVAKIGSLAIQKTIRKADRKFIACTCHHDVEFWLMPDWVFSTDDMTFKKKSTTSQKCESKFSKQKKKKSYGKCLLNTTI